MNQSVRYITSEQGKKIVAVAADPQSDTDHHAASVAGATLFLGAAYLAMFLGWGGIETLMEETTRNNGILSLGISFVMVSGGLIAMIAADVTGRKDGSQ